MVLEAVMFCVDNSEYMRNGDHSPTRLDAQNEAVNYVARAKCEGNQETSVGLLSTAGTRVCVLSSLTRDLGRIMNALAKDVRPDGRANLVGALKTAQLALKNRLNKNQRQRIVVFVGSPVEADTKALEKVAKQLKKNSVAVDVVNFGAENMENENEAKLQALIDAVNSNDNSHLVNIAPGPGILSDAVVTSAVMGDAAAPAGAGGGGFGGGGGGGGGAFGDVNPNEDPELAMALRMSMQEEQARQAAAGGGGGDGGAGAGDAAGAGADMAMDDEEALLQQAIAMSMAAEQPEASAAEPAAAAASDDVAMADASAAAAASSSGQAAAAAEDEDSVAAALQDPSFIESLLDDVGVEKGDADIDDILQGLAEDQDDADKKKKKEEDGNK